MWYKEHNPHVIRQKCVSLVLPVSWSVKNSCVPSKRSKIAYPRKIPTWISAALGSVTCVVGSVTTGLGPKKKGAWRISTWHLKYLKERKKRQFVQFAGIHRCNKSSHRSQRGHIWAFLILENREHIILYTGLTGFGEFVPQIISNDEFYSRSITEMLIYPINVQ